ncbi:MAG: universal stress protein [Planctomycetota bacterium]
MMRENKARSTLPKQIVVGVDDSGLSDHAVEMGLELGGRLEARVELVHAVPVPPVVWPGMDPVRSSAFSSALLSEAMKRMQDRVARLVRNRGELPSGEAGGRATALAAPAVDDCVHVVPGEAAKVLLDRVRRRRSAWIVLGGHRKREILDFGNTLRAVFARSTVPVWVQAHPTRRIERILAPVDLSPDSLASLALARSLAAHFHARLHVLHVFSIGTYSAAAVGEHFGSWLDFPIDEVRTSERNRFDREMGRFDWGGVEHTCEFVGGVASEVILERAEKADLIVLGTHGTTGLASVVLGGTAYAVLKRAPTAVLAARRTRRRFLL